jgi:DNA topoisomerase IB
MDLNLVENIGKVRGRMASKHNRAAKLIEQWDGLRDKFRGMVERGRGETETARSAYGLLVMMATGIRVGNETSAEGFVCINKHHPDFGKEVQTYGLTTLMGEHVEVDSRRGRIVLSFTGKKLVSQELCLTDPFLFEWCPVVKRDARWLDVGYRPGLYDFVKRYVGAGYTPKDLRIAKVNLTFCDFFREKYAGPFAEATRKSDRNRVVRECLAETAAHIGHTPAVCKSAYLSSPLWNVIVNSELRTRFT